MLNSRVYCATALHCTVGKPAYTVLEPHSIVYSRHCLLLSILSHYGQTRLIWSKNYEDIFPQNMNYVLMGEYRVVSIVHVKQIESHSTIAEVLSVKNAQAWVSMVFT